MIMIIITTDRITNSSIQHYSDNDHHVIHNIDMVNIHIVIMVDTHNNALLLYE